MCTEIVYNIASSKQISSYSDSPQVVFLQNINYPSLGERDRNLPTTIQLNGLMDFSGVQSFAPMSRLYTASFMLHHQWQYYLFSFMLRVQSRLQLPLKITQYMSISENPIRADHFQYFTAYLWARLFTGYGLLSCCYYCHFLQSELIAGLVGRLKASQCHLFISRRLQDNSCWEHSVRVC